MFGPLICTLKSLPGEESSFIARTIRIPNEPRRFSRLWKKKTTILGTNPYLSHLWKMIIIKSSLGGDMLVPGKVSKRKNMSKPLLRISLPLQSAARTVCPMPVVIWDHWRSLRMSCQKVQHDLLNWTRQHNGSWDRSTKFQGNISTT